MHEVDMDEMQLDLPVGTLPRLRDLSCNCDVAAAILGCPMTEGQTRPLRVLRGVGLFGYEDQLFKGLRSCPKLKRVELEGYGEIRYVKALAEAAPSITWLDVGGLGSRNGFKVMSAVDDWAPVLDMLPGLRVFHGVCLLYPDQESDYCRKKNYELASLLLRICPKLECVDLSNRGTVTLRKKGDKVSLWVQGAES